MVRLGDVCEISSSKANLTDDKIWLLNLDMVEQQTGKIISYYYVNKNELNGSITQFDTENILYSKLRPNLNKVVVPDRNGFSTSELLPLKPNSKILCREYLALYLRSDSFVSWAISKTAGAKMPRLGTKALLDKEIPLPPLDEQRRIAATLDKVTDLISKRRQQLDKLDELVKARFVEMFGDPALNTRNWPIVPLKECLTSIESGKSFVCSNESRCGKWPAILKLSAVTYGKYIPNENKALLDASQFVESMEIHKGDLLFTRKNTPELVGMAAFVYDSPEKLMMPDLIFRLNTNEKCSKIFLLNLINHRCFRNFIQNLATGSAKSMSNISKERLSNLKIYLPPIEYQNQFSAFAVQIEKIKTTINSSLEKLETLKKALMQEYFE